MGTAGARLRRRGARRATVVSALAALTLVVAACGSAPEDSAGDSDSSPNTTQQESDSSDSGSQSDTGSETASDSETGTESESGSPDETGTTSPEQTTSSDGDALQVVDGFGDACMVTDTGGIDDRSFNANSWKGVQDAATKLGIKTELVQSTAVADYVPNITNLVNEDCGIIITVGALMADATTQAAAKYPDQNFAIVDVTFDKIIPNLRGLAFDASQSAFLAGYLAAGMTKSGTVAQFGGMPIPPVELYMDGFAKGVAYYNEQKGTHVTALGWDPANPDKGLFANSFTDTAKGLQITNQLIGQGADIIFPLAGAVNIGALQAVKQAGDDASMIWVDTDGCVAAADSCSEFISSAEKHISVAVEDAITQAATGHFEAGNYIGTLANDGVGLAPYHQWADRVPQELQDEITQIKQQIIDGDITIESKFKPKTG